MSFRRPAAGRRVGGGVLRVDAARAIAKLRDYQLADPCAWILEAIRAAVASGATNITLDGDANDIWLSWQGGKWPMERLPDLLSELVSPGGPCGREFRLLATGINSALGLQSAYIDVYGFSEKGCQKVRFSPALLKAGEEMGNASPIDALTLEEVKVPPRAPKGCVLFIHLRRRIGMAVLRNFLNREPPEFALVRSSCRELAIPIAVAGKQVEAARTELLRLPLGRDLDGFIALVATGNSEHQAGELSGGELSGGELSGVKLEVAEYGVAITDYVVSVSDAEPQHAMLIRACINAERMPTNASRSGVRRGDHPLRETEALLPKRFSELCQLMIEESRIEGVRGRCIGDSIVRLLAAVISGKGWCRRARHLAAPYRDMAALPLLQNAIGHWQPMNIVWERDIVYTGKVPLGAEFEPWVQAIVWAPAGSAAAALVGTETLPAMMEVRLRRAKTELRSQRRFMAQKERPTSLKRPPRHWVQCSVSANISDTCAPPLNSVSEGELYLLQKGEGSKLTLLLDGKEIETLELRSLLPMRALVSSDMLRAESDYRSVKRNRGFEKVVEATHRSAIRCVEAMCLDGAEGYQYREAASSAELHGLVVKALAMARELGLSVASTSPMAKVMLWPLARGKGLASLLALRSENVVGISLLENFTGEVGERPVVLCSSPWESEVLEAALILETTPVDTGESCPHVVHYNFDVRAFDTMKKAKLVSKTHRGVSMIFAGGGMRGVMSWGLESQENSIHIHHCGRIVERVRHEGLLSSGFISVDSDSIVPSPTWGRAVADVLSGSDFLEVELEFVREFARALVGEAVPTLFSEGPLSLHSRAGQAFASALREMGNWQETLGKPLVRRLLQAPIFATLSGEMCSASELAAVDSCAIEFLEEVPPELAPQSLRSRGLSRLEWNPLVASAEIAEFAGELSGCSPILASEAMQRELIRCKREAHMLRHGKKHVMRLALARASLMPGAEGVVEFSFESAKGLVGISDGGSVMHFFVDSRIFQSVEIQGPLPIVALLSIDSTSIDESFTEILPERVNQFFEDLNVLAPEIIEQCLNDSPSALERPGPIRSFCLGWLTALEDSASHRMNFSDDKKRSRIFSIAKFSDQRGTLRPLEEYVEAGVLRTAALLQNSWVDATPGQEAEALDKPILSFEQEHQKGTLRLLRSLYEDGAVVDYSDAIAKMQVERRLSLGLLLLPTVPVDPRYKRRLSDLGDSDKLGEIGFHQGEQSELRFYESGEFVARRNVAQRPPIWVAIDDPSLDPIGLDGDVEPELRDQIVALTLALAISVVESAETGELPSWLRESLSDALLCGQLAPVAGLRRVSLFMTTSGEVVSWDELVEQENSFGGVWYTDESDTREPIAKGQFALALRLSELDVCDDLLFWQADEDLALDQITRTNRARPKVSSVKLSAAEELSVIGQMPLRGLDGLEGVVAPLLPNAHHLREVRAHRRMRPIGSGVDPCSWPTLCVLEYPKLWPDRTWSAPLDDDAWQELCGHLKRASDEAITSRFPVHKAALTSYWVGSYVESKLPKNIGDEICVRGRLWLGKSAQPGTIVMHSRFGQSDHCANAVATSPDIQLPLHGELWLYSPNLVDPDEIVQQVATVLYGRMLPKMAGHASLSSDERLAHMALGVIAQAGKKALREELVFDCFESPMNAAQLVELAKGNAQVFVRGEVPPPGPEAVTLVDTDTALFRALRTALSHRIEKTSEKESETITLVPPTEVNTRIANTQAHLLSPLANALWDTLASLGSPILALCNSITIDTERITPIVALEGDRIVLAGENILLLQHIAIQLESQPVDSSLVSLLAAHCIEILAEGHSQFPQSRLLHALCVSGTTTSLA